jgi:hypothetical protein
MTDGLTEQRWSELNAKLEAELAVAQGPVAAARERTRKRLRLTLALFTLWPAQAAAALIVHEYLWYAMPLVLVPAVLGVVMTIHASRATRLATQNAERLTAEIRQWKKQRPGGPFARR